MNLAFQIRLGSGSEALKVFKPFYVATGITLTYSNKGTLHQMQENVQQEMWDLRIACTAVVSVGNKRV